MSVSQECSPISVADWQTCLRVLQQVYDEPDAAPNLESLERLIARHYRWARKQRRRESAQRRIEQDRQAVRQTGRVRVEHGDNSTPAVLANKPEFVPLKARSRQCYICKTDYREVHRFYHWLCPDCAKLNDDRRHQTSDMSDCIALVTGGRIKIGFATALKLLRSGATVSVTTRFPRDAARRYSLEAGFEQWQDRLQIHAVDFRDIAGLIRFTEYLGQQLPCLDILINNAAQSVRKQPEHYQRLGAIESRPLPDANLQRLIGLNGVESTIENPSVGTDLTTELPLDRHGEPVDFRDQNSWTQKLEDVHPLEVVETLLVNANAPFLLTSGLKPLLLRSPHESRFVINVTGLDGQFGRPKSVRHPHVNMSKAALNMMTRTSADDYAADRIYMNSVDTGWVTHESGFARRVAMRNKGFAPPLDEFDAAARILDPIHLGLDGHLTWGRLFRNYKPSEW